MQGFNMGRWVPPDQEGTVSANKLHGKRAPGTLRRDGAQTVRFEMPFAVWCHGCQPHAIVGQGVRFNAEKRKVGQYHSTPIWSFRMRHPTCGTTIEIRTDPKHTAFIVTEGGKARDYGDPEDRVREGENGVPILTADEREARRSDAFAQLEGQVVEKGHVADNARRIAELYEASDRHWDDPWAANRQMRESFRRERKLRQEQEKADEALKARLGTDLELLPVIEADAARAELTDFGAPASSSHDQATLKPVFQLPRRRPLSSKPTKSPKEDRRSALRREIMSNTRAARNPFG